MYHPKAQSKKIPCILIAPAGTRMFHGIALASGDIVEHLPYVKAGFAVVAYEVSGFWPKKVTEEAVLRSALDFVKSDGGINDAEAAIKLALAEHPFIDSSRIYVAGHSSAATIALTVAQEMPGVKGCIAYAPAVDIKAFLDKELVVMLDRAGMNFSAYIDKNSPIQNTKKIKCPVFLFSARDDRKVSFKEIDQYRAKLKSAGKKVKYVVAQRGGHYHSMIKQGIPKGIDWIKEQERKNRKRR